MPMLRRFGIGISVSLLACVSLAHAQAIPCGNGEVKCPAQIMPKLNFDFEINLKPGQIKAPPKRKLVEPAKQVPVDAAPQVVTASNPIQSQPSAAKPSWAGLKEVGPTKLIPDDMLDIPGQFIVDLNLQAFADQSLDLKTISIAELASRLGIDANQIRSVQRRFLLSVVLKASPEQLAAMTINPLVKALEADTKIKAAGNNLPLSWGLDRLDSPTLPLDHHFDRDFGDYQSRVYLFDTAIDQSHSEFGNRIKAGARFAAEPSDNAVKCKTHGTEMASLIAGKTTGSAPKAEIVELIVLPCGSEQTGEASSLVEGAEWLLIREADSGDSKPVVANMSLSGKWSRKINDTVAVLTENQVAVVVAAGNNAQDACRFSPSSAKDAIAVAATGPRDEVPGFSNFGSCVALHAPGRLLTALTEGKGDIYVAENGTSGATALVTGLLARALKSKGPQAAHQWLANSAVPSRLWRNDGSDLKLAQVHPDIHNFCRTPSGTSALKLLSGPAANAKVVKALAGNMVVRLMATKQGWVQVEAPGGVVGWISSTTALLNAVEDSPCKAMQ